MGTDGIRDQYVVLTGGKNNAGDFLIKLRGKELLREMRPDREIIDYDSWKPFSSEQLGEINRSRALILLGGPALQNNMRPRVYPMCDDLDEITVPVITMGIGWKSLEGDWHSTGNYKLSTESIDLLGKIERSGHVSGVRDYHTLNVLFNYGFKNAVMTGCPALYSLKHLGAGFTPPGEIRNISFSMGVSFVKSESMKKTMQDTIMALHEYFRNRNFTIVFHHSVNESEYLKSYGSNRQFLDKHAGFIKWLEKNNIPYADISTSADNLMNHYADCDLHIGFRLHAHIFMSSISRPTVLIAEDGRGKALRNVISGLILDGYTCYRGAASPAGLLSKLKDKPDPYQSYAQLPNDVINNIDYEMKNDYPRLSLTRKNIDAHFEVMKKFISRLP